MRSTVTRFVSLFAFALALAGGILGAAAQPAASLDSGALGLSRAEVEARFGRTPAPIDVPGHPIYDETYAYEAEEGTLFVTYREVNGQSLAVYVEFAWRGRGVSEPAAQAAAKSFLPSDAELTALYVAPPTSAGPVALVTNQYRSNALGANPALAPEILVIYHERWDGPAEGAGEGERVEAVSIMIRERTQATG
jgi:hypothetical protein